MTNTMPKTITLTRAMVSTFLLVCPLSDDAMMEDVVVFVDDGVVRVLSVLVDLGTDSVPLVCAAVGDGVSNALLVVVVLALGVVFDVFLAGVVLFVVVEGVLLDVVVEGVVLLVFLDVVEGVVVVLPAFSYN